MAKAAGMAKMVPPLPSPALVSRKRQRKGAAVDEDDDISDTGSVASAASSKTNASVRSRKSVDPSTPVRQSKRLLVSHD